ncbi:hypothetical protein G5714_004118 [Onychostoma macrolepis]|uniref:Heme-binding protein 1 n=1 Tax=Onychostoma macrolepis TaxID=369639 RepID=A0A7J6DBP3_9TELE|nr:hypothetical protein G5714_004118 [Onychostoma macrolepis]
MFVMIKNWLLGATEESEYKLLSTECKDGVSYEVRRYDACKHVCVSLEGRSFDQVSGDLQRKLLAYMSGDNEQGEVMNTPVPIIFTVFPRDDGSLNRRLVISPPAPIDSSIRIEERPGMTVYVLRFGGFPGESEFRTEASRLTCTLGDSAPFQRKQYLCCIYDPPIKPYGRRNEVWLLQDEP